MNILNLLAGVAVVVVLNLAKSNAHWSTEGDTYPYWLKDNRYGVCYWQFNILEEYVGLSYHETNWTGTPFDSVQMDWWRSLHPTVQTRTKPVRRRELREMTKSQLSTFQNALRDLKDAPLNGDPSVTQWMVFSLLHNSDMSPSSTRAGPGQLAWHREFLLRFEEALRRQISDFALPYWDLTLEQDIPRFIDSMVWADEIMGACRFDTNGSTNGLDYVSTGPFKDWDLPDYCDDTALMRGCGARTDHHGFNDQELEIIVNYTDFTEMYTSVGNCMTRDHDLMHAFLYGTSMGDTRCVIYEPASWVFHNFIDYIWEDFRQNHQKTDLETDYPDKVENTFHEKYAEMYPFEMINIDGFLTDYDYYYTFNKRAVECESHSDCGNTATTFCNTKGRCASKVVSGGKCVGEEDENGDKENYGDDICRDDELCGSNGFCQEPEKTEEEEPAKADESEKEPEQTEDKKTNQNQVKSAANAVKEVDDKEEDKDEGVKGEKEVPNFLNLPQLPSMMGLRPLNINQDSNGDNVQVQNARRRKSKARNNSKNSNKQRKTKKAAAKKNNNN